MKLDFKEIAKAWYNVLIHTPEQKELADKRFEICTECPSKKDVLKKNGEGYGFICGECGCPLMSKVYTEKNYLSKDGSCPLNKWRDVETEYLVKIGKIENRKVNKTII